jgi:cytochrome c-type biogenesis protein CcmH/NrfG
LRPHARYAEFWRWRGDYFRSNQRCDLARDAYQKALSISPDLPEAVAGRDLCAGH